MNIITKMLNKNKDRQKRYQIEINGLLQGIDDKTAKLHRFNADPESTGDLQQKIKSLEDDIFYDREKIKDIEMLH